MLRKLEDEKIIVNSYHKMVSILTPKFGSLKGPCSPEEKLEVISSLKDSLVQFENPESSEISLLEDLSQPSSLFSDFLNDVVVSSQSSSHEIDKYLSYNKTKEEKIPPLIEIGFMAFAFHSYCKFPLPRMYTELLYHPL